uniref:Putative secreted protein n=1 Tax=Xenopsylla cheopis TaxID=163159 RepID=A0A6M2DVB5_XENCH
MSFIFQTILSIFHRLAFHFSVLGVFFSPLYRPLSAFFFFPFLSHPLAFLRSCRAASNLCSESFQSSWFSS